ncbi:hypothetical protein FHU10_5055 [Serratia fonticola]|jgi:hypothetical protein|uniref:Uncharacterized protein n=1 Tax=Serratia fonticola TaxID=47917 RepID=A0A542BNC7_SERFO|nr:hypothetical protein FHU09_2648 [Serratia fonticola]TQI97884.1 hypothetical protein FHU11_3395 [Serratia fonticola]TVZ72382.1 hypothetical protein FHU10_5055 [Serratia fonticola]
MKFKFSLSIPKNLKKLGSDHININLSKKFNILLENVNQITVCFLMINKKCHFCCHL